MFIYNFFTIPENNHQMFPVFSFPFYLTESIKTSFKTWGDNSMDKALAYNHEDWGSDFQHPSTKLGICGGPPVVPKLGRQRQGILGAS